MYFRLWRVSCSHHSAAFQVKNIRTHNFCRQLLTKKRRRLLSTPSVPCINVDLVLAADKKFSDLVHINSWNILLFERACSSDLIIAVIYLKKHFTIYKYTVIEKQIEVYLQRKIRNTLLIIFLITKTCFNGGLKSLCMAHVAEFRQAPVGILRRQRKKMCLLWKRCFDVNASDPFSFLVVTTRWSSKLFVMNFPQHLPWGKILKYFYVNQPAHG